MSVTLCRKPLRAGLAIAAICVCSISSALAAGPARGKVVAVDKRTGRAAWEAPLWSEPDAAVPPLITPEMIYVLEEGRTLKALEAAAGRLRWRAPVASSLPLTLAGEIVIAVTDGTARAFNRWNGKLVWQFDPRAYGEWKLDEHSIPVVAPGRLLLPAGNSLIALDSATGQPAWAYTVTAASKPLQPVVINGMVYIRAGREETEVSLKLEDGLPDTGEYTMPPEVVKAIARMRKAERKAPSIARPANTGGKLPFVTIRATVAPGGKALAAAGARRWRFPAPPGWTIDRIAGESPGHLFALLASPAP